MKYSKTSKLVDRFWILQTLDFTDLRYDKKN